MYVTSVRLVKVHVWFHKSRRITQSVDLRVTSHYRMPVNTVMLTAEETCRFMESRVLVFTHTERLIMFSVITKIHNKKTKGPTLMELFTITGKIKKYFWQLETFDVCTTGDTAHIDAILKFLPIHASTWVHRYSSLLQWSVPRHVSLQQWRILH
jgi:hypothetical protein